MCMDHSTKVCSKCKLEKSTTQFGKRKLSKDGLMVWCKLCMSEYDKAREKTQQRQESRSKNPSRSREHRRNKYLEPNRRSKSLESMKAYYQKNKANLIKKKIADEKKDAISVLKSGIKTRIRNVFKRSPYTKKSRTHEILGCSYEEFLQHIERQFLPGMSWERRSEIHIDHIVPLASAKNEQDLIALNHFTNLRPMWAKDNLAKGDAIHYLI